MKRHIVIATAAAAALIAGGTATAVAVNSGDGPDGTRSGAPANVRVAAHDDDRGRGEDGRDDRGRDDRDDDHGREDVREANAAEVTAPQAAAAALKAVPGAVAGLDLDRDRPGLVWEADVLGKDGKWHEVTLDAVNGRVLNQHIDHEDDGTDPRGAKVDAAAAARVSAAHGTVTSVDLDDDHRAKAVWEVETVSKDGKEHKLLVDPRSGKVTAAPAHDADDDDNGGADD
ncbi:PepSY domain-containing protein [Streptomyces sp. NPDC053427]|uniref:PepSY domain-containing protein n=1 Tax=Streptomyces sp. NPDC053427 TaxID=3365701 RepID=UPI0037D17057